MKFYPVYVPRDGYRGNDARKKAKRDDYNRVATKVEKFLNADLAKQPDDTVETYLSYFVARELREDPTLVGDIISGIDGGSNGVTICKGNLDRALGRKPEPPS